VAVLTREEENEGRSGGVDVAVLHPLALEVGITRVNIAGGAISGAAEIAPPLLVAVVEEIGAGIGPHRR
jgi:hypothetical protein